MLRQVSRLRHELRAAPVGTLRAADSNETVEIGLHNDCSTLSSNAAQEIAITVCAVSSAGAVCPRPSGNSPSPTGSSDWQPGMHTHRRSALLRTCQTAPIGAAIRPSPVIFIGQRALQVRETVSSTRRYVAFASPLRADILMALVQLVAPLALCS